MTSATGSGGRGALLAQAWEQEEVEILQKQPGAPSQEGLCTWWQNLLRPFDGDASSNLRATCLSGISYLHGRDAL